MTPFIENSKQVKQTVLLRMYTLVAEVQGKPEQ